MRHLYLSEKVTGSIFVIQERRGSLRARRHKIASKRMAEE